jgi:uncharacterized damage-inducible protein DinB
MATKAIQLETMSEKLIIRWEQLSNKIVDLAEAFSETSFEYRPVEGVRTTAEVLRHVAFWNVHVADRASGRKGEETANELPKEKFSSKKQIVDVVKHSTSNALSALKRHTNGFSPEMAEMLVSFIEHNCEHYGQLVVYARLNRIVPPASRG